MSWTEENKEWTADPAPPGSRVNNRGKLDRTSPINGDRIGFYAVYHEECIDHAYIPEETHTKIRSGPARFTTYVDKVNPFYPDNRRIMAVKGTHLEEGIKELENAGYEVTVRDDQAQFVFTPVPTVGEVVLSGGP